KEKSSQFSGGDSIALFLEPPSSRLCVFLYANEFQLAVDNVIYNPFRNRETIKKGKLLMDDGLRHILSTVWVILTRARRFVSAQSGFSKETFRFTNFTTDVQRFVNSFAFVSILTIELKLFCIS
ncbi:Uncharacterized protein APZ42_021604, partial [Daphnia magna]